MKTGNPSVLFALLSSFLLSAYHHTTLAAGSVGKPEPIFASYAQIDASPTMNLRVEYFRDKPMEELEGFDGYSVILDFTYPINELSSIELLLPLYTYGEGDYDKPGQPYDGQSLDVEGYGGVRDFPSLIYTRRAPWLEQKLGFNFAWLAGAGYRLDTLDGERDGELVDKFNHKGYNYQLGLKADADNSSGTMTLIGNMRYVMFRDTDDINLTGDDIDFEVLYVTGAILLNNYGRVTPALEVLVEHDFEDFTAVSFSPEIIYALSDGLDVKLGAPVKLSSDGQDYAAELELTYRF